MAAPPVEGGSTSATRPHSRPAKQQNECDNPDRQTMGPGGAASEDRPSIDMDGKTETVPIEYLRPNRLQPRRRFDKDGIRALADSIKENGVLQPILVRRHSGRRNQFEIVAGERRYRAAKLARLQAVPVIIRQISDRQALEFALVENIQRRDLTPLERAEGYHRLIQEFNHTQEDLARVLCKSRSHVANTLRLLNLSPAIKGMLQDGKLSAGHARALLNAERPEELAQRIVSDGLSVRATENFAQPAKTNGPGSPIIKVPKSPEIVILERDLAALLGLKVTISTHGQGGTLAVRFTSPAQLEDILRRLSTVDGVPKRHPVRGDETAQNKFAPQQ
jgi:ParB family chromosome partitioning protein